MLHDNLILILKLLDAINVYKEKNRILKANGNKSNLSSLNQTSFINTPTTSNTVIYIKDPNNKNSEIQHVSFSFHYYVFSFRT